MPSLTDIPMDIIKQLFGCCSLQSQCILRASRKQYANNLHIYMSHKPLTLSEYIYCSTHPKPWTTKYWVCLQNNEPVDALTASSYVIRLTFKSYQNLLNMSFLKEFKSLHTLEFNKCNNLIKLALSQCASLYELDLNKCFNLTDVSDLEQCASLHTLDLSGCTSLTNVSDLGQCASLHTLNLNWCIRLTDVSSLGQCASLHTLDLRDCWNVTDVSDLVQCTLIHKRK